MKTVSVEAPQRLLLGIQGEHLTNAIAFDFAPWQNRYGEGSIQLQVQRCGEDAPYPVPLQVDGNLAVWHIERRDTEKEGYGELQLLYIVNGEQVEKSNVFTTVVQKGLSQPGPVPPEEHNFLDQVVAEAAKAELAAKNAEKAAQQTAKDAAQTAEDRTASEQAKEQAIEAAGAAAKDKAAAEGAAKTAVETVAGFDQHANVQAEQLTQLGTQEKQVLSQLGTEERKQLSTLGSQVKESIAQDKADAQTAAEQTKQDATAVSKAAGVVAQQASVVAQQAEETKENADIAKEAAQEVAAIIDDEAVATNKTWSSRNIIKQTADRLAPLFQMKAPIVQGNLVADYPMTVKSHIAPVQEGSGDPSPINVRPIHGMAEVKMTKCGKNLLDSSNFQPYTNRGVTYTPQPDGSIVMSGTSTERYAGSRILSVYLAPGEYIFWTSDNPNAKVNIRINGRYVTTGTFKVASYCKVEWFVAVDRESVTFTDEVIFPFIAVSGGTLSYEPYHGETFTQELPEEVIVGVHDWNSGITDTTGYKMTIDHSHHIICWGVNRTTEGVTGYYVFLTELFPDKQIPPGFALTEQLPIVCNWLKPDKYGAILGKVANVCSISPYGGSPYIAFSIDNSLLSLDASTSTDEARARMRSYLEKHPLVIIAHSTVVKSQQGDKYIVESLNGMTTLYSSTGDTEVTACEHPSAQANRLQNQIDELKNAVISLGGNI